MLYALEHPLSLVVLLAAFLVAVTVHGVVQGVLSRRSGDRSAETARLLSADPRRHLDAFGAVGVALGGLGWGRRLEAGTRRTRGGNVVVHLVPPVVVAALGVALLVGFRAAYGRAAVGGAATYLQHGLALESVGQQALLLGGLSLLYLGALELVPLPPLDGGRLLFALAPRTLGWQKAEHQLVERNIGLAVLLALLLVPLGGSVPPLPALLDIVLGPLVDLALGA